MLSGYLDDESFIDNFLLIMSLEALQWIGSADDSLKDILNVTVKPLQRG
jgi:hypothetical protein